MQARMKHPAMIVPHAMQALQALGKAVQDGGVPPKARRDRRAALRSGGVAGGALLHRR